MFTLQVNLRLAPDKNSAASSSTPSHRKKVGVYGQKSATMDLQVMIHVNIGLELSTVNEFWRKIGMLVCCLQTNL